MILHSGRVEMLKPVCIVLVLTIIMISSTVGRDFDIVLALYSTEFENDCQCLPVGEVLHFSYRLSSKNNVFT